MLYGQSMQRIAAAITRCSGQYANSSFAATCYNFGTGTDLVIKDKEWRMYKAFYKSEKQKIQQRRADELALNFCKGFNRCIGSDQFNPAAAGMLNYSNWSASAFFDILQPCSGYRYELYRGKIRRFTGANDIPVPSANDVEYQLYLESGQCPNARDLQYFLDAMGKNGKLLVGGLLDTIGAFTPRLYKAVHNNTMPVTHQPYQLVSSMSGTQLTARFLNTSTGIYDCTLVLDGTPAMLNWFYVKGFWGLKYKYTSGTTQYFEIHAFVDHDANINTPLRDTLVTGYIGCLNLINCLDSFKQECKPSQLAIDYANLITALKANGEYNGTAISLNVTKYSPFVTQTIRNYIGSSNPLVWNYIGPGGEIRELGTPKMLRINFDQPSLPAFQWLADMQPTNAGAGFTVKAYSAPGVYNTLSGYVIDGAFAVMSMGTCAYPLPRDCRTREHTNKQELEALLNNLFSTNPVATDLNTNKYFTPSLRTYLGLGSFTLTNLSMQDSTFTMNISLNCQGTVPPVGGGTGTGTITPGDGGQATMAVTGGEVGLPPPDCVPICQIYFKKASNSTNNFNNLVGFSNMDVVETERTGGRNYAFKITAHFAGGATEVIYGYTSCIPVRDCNECDVQHTGGSGGGGGTAIIVEGNEYLVTEPGEHNAAAENLEVSPGGSTNAVQFIPPPCGEVFYSYINAVSLYNSRHGYAPGNPGYLYTTNENLFRTDPTHYANVSRHT